LKIKKILVSQPRPTSEKSPYFDIVEKYGVKIDFRPFIKVEPVPAKEFRQQKVSILEHSAVMFTAKTGIDNFFRICEEMRITMPETMKYFCISESVALYLQKYIQYRKRKVFFGATGKLPDLFTVISKHLTESFLVVLSDVHNEEILTLLDKFQVKHDVGIMYRTVSNDFTPEEEFNYDMLIFFSPQGIASLMKNFPGFDQGEIQIGCFGATTANAVRDAGLRLDLEAPRPDAPSMTTALDLFIKENHKNAKK
jgi:Uroporphyrinogen-III synthase